MSQPRLVVERIAGDDSTVRIPLSQSDDVSNLISSLMETLEACFKNGQFQFIIDLKNLPYPSASLIAALIEATARARRLNGEVVIVNASRTAKNNLTTFSALSYLTVDGDASSALAKGQVEAPGAAVEPAAETSEKQEAMKMATKPLLPEAPLLREDISDPPIVGKFEEAFDELVVEGDSDAKQLRVQSLPQNLYRICDFVTAHAQRVGFDSKEIGKTKIAVYEACLNVIEHAYHSNPDNWIDVSVDNDSHKFTIVIQDYGFGFEEFRFKDYDVLSAMDSRKTGGFGLYIIRRSMDEVEYIPDKVKGNRLILTKYLNHILR